MKRLLAAALALVLLFVHAGAQTISYPACNVFYDDDFLVYVASANNTLYVLRESGLYAVAPGGQQTLLLKAQQLPQRIDFLLSDTQAVYALTQQEQPVLRLLVDKNGKAAGQVVLSAQQRGQQYMKNASIRNGILCYQAQIDGQEALVFCPLSGAAETVLPAPGVLCFDLLENGNALALSTETRWPKQVTVLAELSPDGRAKTVFAQGEIAQPIQRMAFDSDTGRAYLFGNGEMYAAPKGGPISLADRFLAGDLVNVALLPAGAALLVDDVLVIRAFEAQNAENKRTLRLMRQGGRGADYRSFLEQNPGVDLQFVSPAAFSVEEQFRQDMVTRSAQTDLYVLEDLNLLPSIKGKGYFADMAANADIATLTKRLYPAFQQAVREGQQIAAFPASAFIDVLCYHKPTFAKLGITPPQTVEEYLDFCLRWLQDEQENYPEVDLNPFAGGLTSAALFARYADECAKAGKPVVFSTPYMEKITAKYLRLQKAVRQTPPRRDGTKPLFYSHYLLMLDENSEYGYLPLAFEPGIAPVLTPRLGDVTYFVINPYGKNIVDALAFVAAADKQRQEVETALLYADVTEPMESAVFQSEQAAQQRALAQLEAMLEKAGPTARQEAQAQADKQRLLMEDYEKNSRWAVTRSALTVYQQLADKVYLPAFNPVIALGTKGDDSFKEMQSLPVGTFLRQLDAKLQLVRLEQGP